jgi:hypothetical protein
MDYQDFVPNRKILVKQWAREAISKSGLKQSYLAHQMSMSEGRLSQFLDLESDHPGLHACNLPILLKETHDLTILDRLETLFGRLAFKVPVNGETDKCLLVGRILKQVGELAMVTKDGNEARVVALGEEAIRSLACLIEVAGR